MKLDLSQFDGITPGPWRAKSDAQGDMAIMHPTQMGVAIAVLDNGYVPANGFVEIESPGAPERSANFRLLFAAPSLLAYARQLERERDALAEALENLLSVDVSRPRGLDHLRAATVIAQSALAALDSEREP